MILATEVASERMVDLTAGQAYQEQVRRQGLHLAQVFDFLPSSVWMGKENAVARQQRRHGVGVLLNNPGA